jgi:hypothetical protein
MGYFAECIYAECRGVTGMTNLMPDFFNEIERLKHFKKHLELI